MEEGAFIGTSEERKPLNLPRLHRHHTWVAGGQKCRRLYYAALVGYESEAVVWNALLSDMKLDVHGSGRDRQQYSRISQLH